MERRLSTGQADRPGPEVPELPEASGEGIERDRLRGPVELVAVAAAQIAAPDDDQLREERPEPEPVESPEARARSGGGHRRPARPGQGAPAGPS